MMEQELMLQRLRLFSALKAEMGEPEFTKWFVETFREKLAEVKGVKAERDRNPEPRLTTSDLMMDEAQELAHLRRLHGKHLKHLVGKPDELEQLRKVHENWLHPAKSDRGKYEQEPVFWNGDCRERL